MTLPPGSYSVVCDSLYGELICVKALDFAKKVKTNDASYSYLMKN
jgi:hypothetical protein